MPSVSKKQHKLMEAAAHTPGGYGGVPQAVGKDFAAADKGKAMNKFPDEAPKDSTPTTPVAGQQSGGGAGVGLADHHVRSGDGTPHKFDKGTPSTHHMAEHHRGSGAGVGREAHAFSGTQKAGLHRVSGKSGAHQLGKKK